MEAYCTRPRCPRPKNYFADLDDVTTLKTAQQKYCATCGMPLILDGRYMSTKLLGRGGFASAFLARDRRIPGIRACVVKQFQPAGDISSNQLRIAQQLFEREADVLAEIGREHEQIPELYAFFQVTVPSFTQPNHEEQFFYLVQEYIDGLNLEEELTQKGKFSEAEILYLLQEILKILKFVHDKSILHRDIKPSNIMRRQDGKLFLLDFGAVKQVTNVASGTVASSSTGIYSAGFAPPEQMTGNQVFPCTDLYALAVTAVTLLTGESATQLFDPLINQWTWRSLVNINPHLADVLDKMLLPAVSQRFQSAEEVLAELFTQVIPPTTLGNTPPQPQVIQPHSTFSTWELLAGAAFSGFESALIAIALSSLLPSAIITLMITSVILALIIFAQTRRWIEKTDLLIIAGITFAIVFFVPFLQAGLDIQQLVILAVASSLIAIAFTTLFRLIYKLLSMMF
ncbi:serine/threonine protein kinase [Nostoc sp. CHAB 5844]|nr:serine/threonine protein kinase [Nostoc sp. CHAB 5844]